MGVFLLWVIYIVVVIAVWLVLWVPQLCIELDMILAAFIALVIGAIVIFLLSPTVGFTTLDKTQSTWLSVLFIIAYLLPILLLLWIILAGYVDVRRNRHHKMRKQLLKQRNGDVMYGGAQSQELSNCKYQIEVVCDNDGNCSTTMAGMDCDQGEGKVLFV